MRGPITKSITAALLVSAAVSASAQDAEQLLLQPTSQWVLAYEEDSCALRRSFAADDVSGIIELREFGPGDYFRVVFVSADLGQPSRGPIVEFNPGGEAFEPVTQSGQIGDDHWGIIFDASLVAAEIRQARDAAGPDAADADQFELPAAVRDARERAVDLMVISAAFDRDVGLNLGAMHPQMEAMRGCIDRLIGSWGTDASAYRSLSRRAAPVEGQFERVARAITYPSDMLASGNQARLQLRLDVSAQGRVTDCHLQVPIEHDSFRRSACRDLSRVRFEPALDAEGQAVDSFWITTMRYEIG